MFSIVVPTFHARNLYATLAAIAAQSRPELIAEVLVVGQQTQGPWRRLPKVRYIEVPDRPSPARNRNVGAAQACGEYICFTDSDCLPYPDWISTLQRCVAAGAEAVAGAVAWPSSGSYWDLCDYLLAFGHLAPLPRADASVDYGATLNFALARDVFVHVGGFDETFHGAAGEDWDFCDRLRRAGYRIAFEPGSVVDHRHERATLGATWQHLSRFGAATAQRRLQDPPGLRWRLSALAGRQPILGELLAVTRVLGRGAARLVHQPGLYRDHLQAWPGVLILDLAHSLGIISYLRSFS